MLIIFLMFLLFFFIFLLVQLVSGTMMLGIFLFLVSLLSFMYLCYMNLIWYGLLFFLIYMGGLLVLFFYVISINSNLNIKMSLNSLKISSIFFFFFFVFFLSFFIDKYDFFFSSQFEENSFSLFNSKEENYVVFLGLFLSLMVILVGLFTRRVNGALRPFKK